MKTISSRYTPFYKYWLFPGLFLVWAFLFFFVMDGVAILTTHPQFFAMPVLVLAALGVAYFQLFWGVADEVVDLGDAFLVKKGGREERVDYRNVITAAFAGGPRRSLQVRMALRQAGIFGREVRFLAAVGFFSSRELFLADLLERVNLARAK